ncbi:hypothetical protein BJX99DRAFT_265260 [Aspergillus californicus]
MVESLFSKFPHRKSVFVAHSLGVILLKKALQLGAQYEGSSKFDDSIAETLGYIFLGRSHRGKLARAAIGCVNQILINEIKVKSFMIFYKKPPALDDQDMYRLDEVATGFKRMITSTVPILSVREVQNNDLSSDRKGGAHLKNCFEIGSAGEKVLTVDVTHEMLCCLPKVDEKETPVQDSLQLLLQRKLPLPYSGPF